MGKKTTEEKLSLMEFLYKDDNLINSLYSQVFGGDLETVSKMAGTTEDSTLDTGITFGIAKTKGVSKDSIIEQLTKNINPKDAKIIDLFEELNIKNYEKSLHRVSNGKIIKLDVDISFRNLDTFKDILPLFKELGYIPNIFSENDTDEVKSLFIDFISMNTPKGLEFELTTNLHEKLNCSIDENFLMNDNNSLLKSYKSKYLGKWTVIGIFDNILAKTDQSSSSDINLTKSIDEVEKSLFEIFYTQESNKFVLKPIIIYRTLKY